MIGIIRIYQDAYGNNMGARTFCHLSKYFGGVLITDNKKIHALKEYRSITYEEALANRSKFTKLLVYNTKPNMFGGVAAKHTPSAVRLIEAVPDVFYVNCDPILHLPKDVADSHERQVPGLRKAIYKLNNHGTILDRTNTDLTLFLAANTGRPILKRTVKKYDSCYFGDPRGPERQKQVQELLSTVRHPLIIGHEHAKFPWFYYTPDFYDRLNEAWTSPVIGDSKLHYETGIPSLRLYEIWHTSCISLIDRRFTKVEGLDESFFFSNADEFMQKTKIISETPECYEKMLNKQKLLLKKLKRKYEDAIFDWSQVRRKVRQARRERKQLVVDIKQAKVDRAVKRLEHYGVSFK